jgi:hypothetical protein
MKNPKNVKYQLFGEPFLTIERQLRRSSSLFAFKVFACYPAVSKNSSITFSNLIAEYLSECSEVKIIILLTSRIARLKRSLCSVSFKVLAKDFSSCGPFFAG